MRRDGRRAGVIGTAPGFGGLLRTNTPQQPKDRPVEPKKVDHDSDSPMQNGIPKGTKQEEATAVPDTGRQHSETAGSNDG